MAFSKLYSVVPDGAIGYQTLNQAADNNAELRTQTFVEHGTREPGTPGGLTRNPSAPDYARLGRHNLLEIPRTVSQMQLYLLPSLTIQTSLVWTGVGINSVWRWSTGVYLAHVVGLSTFWATAVALAGSSVTYLPPIVRPFYASATNGNNAGLWISTYSLDTGDFVPIDSAITLALYGSP